MADQDPYPLVSCVLLAGRISKQDLHAAIDCFKAQTYPYKELVIVNNAPSQFAASELNIKAEKDVVLIDTPLQLFAGMARNYGIATANGQIIAQFDADYWHAPNRLETQILSLAENEAHISILNHTLNYSTISGRASYNENDKKAILGTMVFIRPDKIDYPNIDKQEELGLLERMIQANMKIISSNNPELACKLCLTKLERTYKPVNCGLSKDHFKLVKRIVKNQSNHHAS